jgi:outer membrane cobalamin receptor
MMVMMIGIVFAAGAMAQDSAAVSGRVLDKATRSPIPGANVMVDGTSLGVCANADGYYRIDHIPPGLYHVRAGVPGYLAGERDIRLLAGESRVVVFELDETVYQLNPVTVTATRERSLVSDVPAVVDIVSAREIERRNVQDVREAIATIPGVFAKDYGTVGDLKTVSIRGSSSSQVLIMVDGQRINNAQSGDVDLSTIPMEGVERIEVVRGGSSALYGADAVGGVINIITKTRGYEPGIQGNAKLLAGSFGLKGIETGGSYSTDRFFSTFSYKLLKTRGDIPYRTPAGSEQRRANADAESHGLFGKGMWSFGDDGLGSSLSFSGQYYLSHSGAPGTNEGPKLHARKANRNLSFNGVYDQKVGSPYSSIRAQAYFHNNELWYDDPDAYVPEHSFNHNTAWGGEVQGRTVLTAWNVVTGGYAFRGDMLAAANGRSSERRTMHSLYAQDEISPLLSPGGMVRRIVVIPAVRWDRFSDFGGRVSPKVGLVISSGERSQVSLKANYGSSFRAPSFNDLYWPKDAYSEGNPGLKPERGSDFDVGTMVRLPDILGLSLDLTYFHSDITDLILWQPNEANLWMPQNIGTAAVRGIETRVAVNPLGEFATLEWNYTWLDARNKNETPVEYDKQLPYRPRNTHNLIARCEYEEFSAGVTFSYYGKRFTTTANTKFLEPYDIVDLLVGWKTVWSSLDLRLTGEVRNVRDRRFEVMDGFPMPGREYRFTIGCGIAHSPSTPEEQMRQP